MKIHVKIDLDHISKNPIKAISKTKSDSGGIVRKPHLFHQTQNITGNTDS